MTTPRVDMHFVEHFSCGHSIDLYAFVGTPEFIIAHTMEFAWAGVCYQCDDEGKSKFVMVESVEFIGYEEVNNV